MRSGTPFDLALTITNEGPNPELATFSIDPAGWGVVYVDRRGYDDSMDVQLGAPIALPSAVVEGMSKGDKTIRVAIAKGGKARAVLHLIASRHTEPVKSTTRTHYAPRVVDRPLAPGNYEVRGWPMNGVTFDENWVLLAPPLSGAGTPQSSSVSREMLGAGKLFTIVP